MTGGTRKVFVVFKTHFDIGFTGLVDEVLDSYARVMFPRAIEACRQSMRRGQRMVWTVPAWPLAHCLEMLRGTPAEKVLEEAAADGTLAWHALPFSLHTELFGLEDLVRGFSIARAMTARFGRSAVAAKMTDVPGHTWILPTLLADAGVVFLHLGCNACSTPPDVPPIFHWEGPDGSRVITMYSRGGYGSSLFPPPGWKHPVWLSLQHTQDNAGPPGAEAAESILAEVHARFPRTEVIFGTLDDFGRAIADLGPNLPVVRKDLADSWIHGTASMPREVGILRAVRSRLVRAESALSLRSLAGEGAGEDAGGEAGEAAGGKAGGEARASLRASLAAAYEKILLFGEHTWGMDTKLALNPPEFGGRAYDKTVFKSIRDSGKYARIQRSWTDKAALVAEAERHLAAVESHLVPRGSAGGALEVVNHHVWEWSGPVRIGDSDRDVRVFREDSGAEIPALQMEGELWGMVEKLPPLSRVRLKIREAHPDAVPGKPSGKGRAGARSTGDRLVLENGMLRIRASRDAGGITSLVDLATGREWVQKGAEASFGHFRYDVYSRREIVSYLKSYAYDFESWFLDDFGKPGYPEIPHETFHGELAHAETETGAGWARLRLLWRQDPRSVHDLGSPEEVRLDCTLLDGQPWLDMRYALGGKQACPLLEAGHVVMPFSAETPRFAVNKTGSVIDAGSDIAPGANRLMFCCEDWVDVADRDGGVLVIPFDSPLFSIGDPAIERFDGAARPGRPCLYFNLFNTQWGTNFPQWIEGSFTFRFRVVPHPGDWRRARAWEHAAAALHPPTCFPAGPTGRGTPALLARPARGLQTVVLKRAETGDAHILRLREPTGRGGKRSLSFNPLALGDDPALTRCSLLEEEREPVPLRRVGDFLVAELTVRPFEVLTLKVRASS